MSEIWSIGVIINSNMKKSSSDKWIPMSNQILMGVCFMKNLDPKPSKLPKRPFKNCEKTYFTVLAIILLYIYFVLNKGTCR